MPFHLYSMRQAIEEGFILDVLANYTTYKTYFRIEKAITDDPEYDEARARRAIARFVTLHPHNLAQKAEIIVEHFRAHTAAKIGGRAKAMVVTQLAPARGAEEAGDRPLHRRAGLRRRPRARRVLRDVSTSVTHRVADERLPRVGDRANGSPADDYQVLVVAEKFQTGFDQPLLHTMYVDKVLTGLNAVQTLSRLNRIHPDKTDTFVLDFRNELEDIQAAFEPYYERTRGGADRPEPALRHEPRAVGERRAARGRGRAGGRGAARRPRRPEGTAQCTPRSTRRSSASASSTTRRRTRSATSSPATSTSTRSCPRSCRSPTARSSATTSTPARSPHGFPIRPPRTLDLGSEVELTHLKLAQTFEGSGSLETGGGEVVAIFSGRGPAARGRAGAALADRRRHQRPLRARPRRDRPAPVRPVRGELGRRRDPRRPRAHQRLRQLPARLRPDVRRHDRQARRRQRGDLQEDPRRARLPADRARVLRGQAVRPVAQA